MAGFFRRFFLGEFGPPPPPDLCAQPSISEKNVVETLYSKSKCKRAVIARDVTGTYSVHIQIWDISDWKEWRKAFWYGDASSSITDCIETARRLAQEDLSELC